MFERLVLIQVRLGPVRFFFFGIRFTSHRFYSTGTFA